MCIYVLLGIHLRYTILPWGPPNMGHSSFEGVLGWALSLTDPESGCWIKIAFSVFFQGGAFQAILVSPAHPHLTVWLKGLLLL